MGGRTSFAAFMPKNVIKGWGDLMLLMVEGDYWELYIPAELGHGDKGFGKKIKTGDVVIYRMDLVRIKGEGIPSEHHACDPSHRNLKGCTPAAKTYIEKMRAKGPEKIAAEYERLHNMQGDHMD